MTEHQAQLLLTWRHEDAMIQAHFNNYVAQLRRAADAWATKEPKDLKRAAFIIEANAHIATAVDRFAALMKDHEYWAKRWSGVAWVPLIKEGQIPKKA